MDLCNTCISGLGISTLDRPDLEGPFTSIYDDPDFNEIEPFIPDGEHNGWLTEDEL